MRKMLLPATVCCLIVLSNFAIALGGSNATFDEMIREATVKSLIERYPSMVVQGEIPENIFGDYVGSGDQTVAFRILKSEDKRILIYAWKHSSQGRTLIFGGTFSQNGSEYLFTSDNSRLKIYFERGNGKATVIFEGNSSRFKSIAQKIN